LRCGALPIVNENDTVSVDELKLGDNDTLGATVAALIDADVLFIATDIDGLYDADPRTTPGAQPMRIVTDPGDDILAMAGGAGSKVGTGGMRTKILAAQRAGAAGIDTVLFNGTRAEVSIALSQDRLSGTRLIASRSRVAARKHWLRHAPVEQGAAIVIDAGAARALIDKGASLLPIGVADAQGEFRRGDLVEIVLVESMRVDGERTQRIARGVTQYFAADIRRIARRQSHEIEAILGYNYGHTIVHRDDLSLHASHPNEAADV
jgi:glutamate 5-kinase